MAAAAAAHEPADEKARFDINLAPLEVGNPFCEAKSQLKFFEAGLVNCTTIASPTGPVPRLHFAREDRLSRGEQETTGIPACKQLVLDARSSPANGPQCLPFGSCELRPAEPGATIRLRSGST